MTPDPSSRRIDLDGLQVFDAVMRERHVTRAAERLSLSQSAVSHALARLRVIFGDPLFVRTAGGVRPTRRAEQLWNDVQEPLRSLRRAVAPGGFDPATAEFEVSIAVNDMITEHVLTPWYARLRTRAPGLGVSLVMRTYGDTEARLEKGTLDFGLGLFASIPRSTRRQEVWSDRYVCAFRSDHPLARRPLTLEAFESAAHVRVSPSGERFSFADVGMRLAGVQRRVALVVSHFTGVPKILQQTDLIALMPRFFARAVARTHRLSVRELPFPADPVRYELVWHERAERSPALVWIRDELLRDARPRNLRASPAAGHEPDA